MQIGNAIVTSSNSVRIPIDIRAYGDETAASFTLAFDEGLFANPRVTLGPAAPEGSTLTVNAEKDGRIAILIDSSEPMTASAMPTSLIYVEVEVVANADRGPTMIAFTGDLAGRAMSDGLGRSLPTIYTDGVVVIGDPNDRVAIDRSIDLWFMVRPLSSMVGTSLGVF